MEAIAEMTEVVTEDMEEIDLNEDLTVEENILEEMIETEVPEVVIESLELNKRPMLTFSELHLTSQLQ